MEFTSIPVIVLLCYLIGEIYKVLFKSKEELNKLIPIIVSLIGGCVGILIYLTDKDFMKVSSIYDALLIGLVSGSASTGTNQIIKNVFKTKEKDDARL